MSDFFNPHIDRTAKKQHRCTFCAENQSAIDVWEGRYADLSAKCAELEDFCISQGNDLAKLDEKVFDQDRLLKQQAEKISATLVALAGLPDGALDGGWTYAGMSKYTLGLEADRDALAMQNQQIRDALRVLLKFAETVGPSSCFWEDVWPEHENAECCDHSEVIKRHDAAVLRKAAESAINLTCECNPAAYIRHIAEKLEKSCPPSN